jgi:hypothetical protein
MPYETNMTALEAKSLCTVLVLPTTAKSHLVLFQIPATSRSKTVRDGEFDETRDAAPYRESTPHGAFRRSKAFPSPLY